MKEKDFEIKFSDVPLKYYPLIYLYAIKSLCGGIIYKKKYSLESKIVKSLEEITKLINNNIQDKSNYTLFDMKSDIIEITQFISEMTEWYETKFNNRRMELIYNKDCLKEEISNLNNISTLKEESFIKGCTSDLKKYFMGNKEIKIKESILNLVMYNIIKNGGSRFGPRRGLLFALEFDLDIDVPMKYGIEGSYLEDKKFIKAYLDNGGDKDLKIFINFFSKGFDNFIFDYMSIDEIINLFYSNDIKYFYNIIKDNDKNKILSLKNNTEK